MGDDEQLQDAIRHELGRQGTGERSAKPTHAGTIAKLRQKRQRLLDLYYADKISPAMFADEEARLTKQIQALEGEAASTTENRLRQTLLAEHFEQVATLLRNLDLDRLWDAASEDEKRILVFELVESVIVPGPPAGGNQRGATADRGLRGSRAPVSWYENDGVEGGT